MSSFIELHVDVQDAGEQAACIAVGEIVMITPAREYERGPKYVGIKGSNIHVRGEAQPLLVVESYDEITSMLRGLPSAAEED